MKRALLIITNILAILLAAWLGYRLAIPSRTVETGRMEKCLEIYSKYRKDFNQHELEEALTAISLTPKDFQIIIDKFIYYRTRKSSLDQAMALLRVFENGFKIDVEKVETVSDMESEPFRLDAEILKLFKNNPTLIEKAFSS
jgi:hypothetical protein